MQPDHKRIAQQATTPPDSELELQRFAGKTIVSITYTELQRLRTAEVAAVIKLIDGLRSGGVVRIDDEEGEVRTYLEKRCDYAGGAFVCGAISARVTYNGKHPRPRVSEKDILDALKPKALIYFPPSEHVELYIRVGTLSEDMGPGHHYPGAVAAALYVFGSICVDGFKVEPDPNGTRISGLQSCVHFRALKGDPDEKLLVKLSKRFGGWKRDLSRGTFQFLNEYNITHVTYSDVRGLPIWAHDELKAAASLTGFSLKAGCEGREISKDGKVVAVAGAHFVRELGLPHDSPKFPLP